MIQSSLTLTLLELLLIALRLAQLKRGLSNRKSLTISAQYIDLIWLLRSDLIVLVLVATLTDIGVVLFAVGVPSDVGWHTSSNALPMLGCVGYAVYFTEIVRQSTPAVSPLYDWLKPYWPIPYWVVDAFLVIGISSVFLIHANVISLLVSVAIGTVAFAFRVSGSQFEPRALVPAAGLLFGATLLSIVLGEVDWVSSPSQELIGLLASGQLLLGVIPITVAGAIAPLLVGWLGLRGIAAVPRGWLVLSLVALLASVAIDIGLLGMRAIPSHTAVLAETLSLLVLLLAGLTIVQIFELLDPERVLHRLVQRLDDTWVQRVRSRGQHGATAFPSDPFDAIERLLITAALRDRDRALFAQALQQLLRRIDALAFESVANDASVRGPNPELEADLDLYITGRLGALLVDGIAARLRWVSIDLLAFRAALEPARRYFGGRFPRAATGYSGPALLTRGTGIRELPPGFTFYGLIANLAIRYGSDDDASDAFRAICRQLERTLQTVPSIETSMMLSGDTTPGPADHFAWDFDGILRVLMRLSEDAASRQMKESLRQLGWGLASLIEQAVKLDDERWAASLIQTIGSAASSVAAAGAAIGARAYRVPQPPDALFGGGELTCRLAEPLAAAVELAMLNAPQDVVGGVSVLEVSWLVEGMSKSCPSAAGALAASHLYVARRYQVKGLTEVERADTQISARVRPMQRREYQRGYNDQLKRLETAFGTTGDSEAEEAVASRVASRRGAVRKANRGSHQEKS